VAAARDPRHRAGRAPVRVVLAAVIAAACGDGGLSALGAGRVVQDHLAGLAPRTVRPDSFAVLVDAVDGAGEERRVRFRTVWAFADTSGASVDTSRVLTATVRRAAGGWQVAGYDEALTEQVIVLLDEEQRRRYEDLLDAVHHIYHVLLEGDWYGSPWGIDEAAVRARVEAGGHAAHLRGTEWGITPDPDGLTAQILWLRDAADPGVVCALPVTEGRRRPEPFDWVRDDTWFSCRGRGAGIYSRAALVEDVEAEVARTGVVRPRG
jgi:hypothetical protein